MRQVIFCCILVVSGCLAARAQTIVCDTSGFVFNYFARVTASSGLNLRATPSAQSARLAAIPGGMEIPVDANMDDMPYDTFEGKETQWRRVSYAGKTGYVFGGFVEVVYEKTSVRLVAPGAGVDSELGGLQLDPGLIWHALVPPVKAGSTGSPDHRWLEGLPVELGAKTGEPPGARPLNLPPETAVIFGGIEPDSLAAIYYFPKEPQMLFPGEIISFDVYDPALRRYRLYQVYATGHPVPAPEGYQESPFSAIRGYELRVRELGLLPRSGPDAYPAVADQCLFSACIKFEAEIRRFLAPRVHMLGDFDGDHRLDAILSVHTDKGVVFYLFLSSKAMPGFMMRVVAGMWDSYC